MATQINVVSSEDQQPFAASGNTTVQGTKSSESLGVPADKEQGASPDPAVLNFLSSEASGTVYDTPPKHVTNYVPAEAVTGALFLIVVIIALVIRNNQKLKATADSKGDKN